MEPRTIFQAKAEAKTSQLIRIPCVGGVGRGHDAAVGRPAAGDGVPARADRVGGGRVLPTVGVDEGYLCDGGAAGGGGSVVRRHAHEAATHPRQCVIAEIGSGTMAKFRVWSEKCKFWQYLLTYDVNYHLSK